MRLALVFIFFSFSSLAQNMANSIGLVTFSADFDESNTQFEILNKDGTVWLDFDVACSENHLRESCKKVEKQLDIIGFGIASPLLKIRCIAANDSLYEIVVQEDNPVIKYIRKDERLTLETWSDYILSASILGFKSETNPLRKEINGLPFSASELALITPFKKPVAINGDWVKLHWRKDEAYNREEGFGWIKWKEGNKIIVEVQFLV